MPILDFIPDGYQEHGYCAARLPIHNDFRFTYRPMLIEERAPVLDLVNRLAPADYLRQAADSVAPRIAIWSAKDRAGSMLPVSADNLRRLKPMLQQRIINIVLGVDAGDVDPTWDYDQNDLIQSLRKEAEANKESVAATREAADLKN